MDQKSWINLAIAACDDAHIAHSSIEIVSTWDQKFLDSDVYRSNAVFRIGGQRCLKLYGPNYERQFHAERSALRTLAEHSSTIPAPRFIAARERSQLPPYLIMTEITGATVEDSWKTLLRTEQLTIAREIGAITAAVHRLPQEDLADVEWQFGGRRDYARTMQAERIAQIEAAERLSIRQRDALLHYLSGRQWTVRAPPDTPDGRSRPVPARPESRQCRRPPPAWPDEWEYVMALTAHYG